MFKVRYSYLAQQFADPEPIFAELKKLVLSGDFTLGKVVGEFERKFADLIGVKHAIGVGSGTDALKLPLRALEIGHGDEVITAANTFIATVGAIAETGARPVLVDCDDSFCIDVAQVEAAITPRTKAIMPVQLTGEVTNMTELMKIAEKHGLPVVEDACQGILSEYDGKRSGTWGSAAGFSLHPLKNLNVWGDGGVVVTNDDAIDARLRLIRNHGMKNRDEISILGHNSRLDSVQAVVGNWLIGETHDITNKRIANGAYYDAGLGKISGIRLPPRRPNVKRVFHLYMVFAKDRDALYQYCLDRGVEAKVHYPIPLYQQEGLRPLGYPPGHFPVTDRHAALVISFPVDQHITRAQQDYVIEVVSDFYSKK
ncbi:MAG: DegT/DnrJ/EryC1/StrS family aminotransferase [Alphaproteobacteria bacterium]|nr:DegT/DnrJ/EryC1/StrS family aminotransferase [Alphaproteobacteria bacterium]